ncbi:triphosphoribosyl-dephospho-CoA synthase [Arenibaculum pallidiluteum]|uniref:triphosphoribosyl-dephospho-CoA synthase n=1 Tax=Arenibaculum pallidiluteum TaxID=2812559 RepID=UPI001B3BF8E6|nr:triphosphoribosyl-dephospho-CoA synthase [Arenibaculum pallidiluteum]
MSWPDADAPVAELFVASCRAEILALKPGNVHVHADGHGMTAQQFLDSAEAAAPPLTAPGRTVGERILDAVRATRAVAGCNTNLGIVLLTAPVAQALEEARPGEALRQPLARVLDGLTVGSAEKAYEAIRIASPGGLGRSGNHDVAEKPRVTLLAAMQEAAGRDRIAAQYAGHYADVFEIGMRAVEDSRQAAADPVRAVEAAYWDFLTAFEDSHVARKHGNATAAWLLRGAREIRGRLDETASPLERKRIALEFDEDLKRRGINPGTSADLAVCALFAVFAEDRLSSATPSHP